MPDMLRNENLQPELATMLPALPNSTVSTVTSDSRHVDRSTMTNALVALSVGVNETRPRPAGYPRSGGGGLRLSPIETRLMTRLREAPEAWLTALDLARQVLGRDDRNGEILVRQYVFRLRKRIEASGHRIEHVRTRGYRLIATMSPA